MRLSSLWILKVAFRKIDLSGTCSLQKALLSIFALTHFGFEVKLHSKSYLIYLSSALHLSPHRTQLSKSPIWQSSLLNQLSISRFRKAISPLRLHEFASAARYHLLWGDFRIFQEKGFQN
jgi:hypothetical protein